MRRFGKPIVEYRVKYRRLIDGDIEWRLYPYTPRDNEFERGLKYSLCKHTWFGDDDYEEVSVGKFSSIKKAEEYLHRDGYIYK